MVSKGLKKLRIVISVITALYLIALILSNIIAFIDESAWLRVADDPTITFEDWQTFNKVLNKVEDTTLITSILGYLLWGIFLMLGALTWKVWQVREI